MSNYHSKIGMAIPISPTSGVKRERSNEEDNEMNTRRVLQRTDDEESEDNEEAHAAHRSIQDVVTNDLFSHDEGALTEALKQVARLLYSAQGADEKELETEFYTLGGHFAVVRAMKDHPDREMLQVFAIYVILNATFYHPEMKTAFAKVGGMQCILVAMKKFPRATSIQRPGVKALFNLLHKTENAELFVTKLDGVFVVVQAMKNVKENEEVMLWACRLFCHLLSTNELRRIVRDDKAKVAVALSNAYYGHNDNSDIKIAAREALKLLMSE